MMRSSLVVLLVLVAFGAFVLIRYGWSDDSGDNAAPTPRPAAITPFCVEAIGLSDEFESFALERIASVVGDEEYYGMPVLGCPPPTLLRDVDEDLRLAGWRVEKLTAYEGRHNVFVYVFPEGEVPIEDIRRVSEEVACEGDACGEVSSGLYIEIGELCDDEVLRLAVLNVMGIVAENPLDPTPYFDPPPTFGITPSPSPTPCY